MVVKIGQTKAPGDLVDALLDCHERIRRFISTARRIAESEGAPAKELTEAAWGVWRYFNEALPRHVADEDESILPRLRGRDPEVDLALAVMHREHGEHSTSLARLVEICDELRNSAERHATLSAELLSLSTQLQREFETHLEQEERTILPAIRKLLDPTEQAEISREMVMRRQP